jgi:hypothetical protein
MSVWYAIPSKRPVSDVTRCLSAWKERGYQTGVWRDHGDELVWGDMVLDGAYPGYAASVNGLCREIISIDCNAEWIVTGGDDVFPDETLRAEEIGAQCSAHFGGTFGVMQPTGDRWGEAHPPHDGTAYSDRVCGSPWMGREFCERMYGGNGPMHDAYTHMGVDEELQAVASLLGVLWQRRELIHQHEHWGRQPGGRAPEFLRDANSPAHWNRYKAIFEGRRSLGFPGHEPLVVA